MFKKEITIIEEILKNPHPNIVKYYGYYVTLDQRPDMN